MTHFEIDPPYDELAERAVLGAMILDPEVIPQVLEYLREEDFYIDNHRLLFSLLYKLWEDKGKDWDDIVLREYINRYGLKDKIDMSFIYALVDEAAKGALLQEAINLVKEKSGLRSLMDLSFNTLRGIKEEPDFNRLLDLITHRVLEISEKQTISHYHHIREVASKVIDIIEKHRKEERLITGRATGFLDLDILTTGLHPSDLVIVAARPGMGKSSFMLSMAINMAMEEKVPVIIYSLEMSKEQLTMRALSMLSGVPLQNMRRGFIKEEERSRLIGSALELSRCEIYIDDTPTLSTTDLRIKTRKLKKERGVQVAFIDYLQLLRPPVRKSSRQEEVAEISRNLKALAKELSIPVVALAQLSRQVEHRSDKRPQLADLRECLSGDTIIIDAKTGISYTIEELYKTGRSVEVYSLDLNTLKIVSKPVEKVVFSGYKEVYELRTRSGRSIKASNNHPFLTPFGWKELKDIQVGDYIAVSERYPKLEIISEHPEELCWFIGKEKGIKKMSEKVLYEVTCILEDKDLETIALSEIFFDEVVEIRLVGLEPTYDLVIPETHNFVANHIIVHNSGQIEQDADLIIFIHRPEYYKRNPPPEEQGIAEIIVAKQRQGPTGIIKVAFMKDTASFKSLESSHMQKIESYEPDLEDFSEEDYDLDF
ncbi:replicative DNA helicase [Hydrogenobacter thermophilus]|uniref:replicative DNA helicase n=1 Tax=Hydrogenobacter thermophilus TaxID=940 RepID=UPI0030FAB174